MLARRILIAHAAPGSKMLTLVQEAMSAGRTVMAVEASANSTLFDLGAVSVSETCR
jgi:hypothetical protein